MMTKSLQHFMLVIQAVLWGSLDDYFMTVFIATRMSGEIKVTASKADGGSHSCPYISFLLKFVQNLVAAGFAT